MAGKRISPKKSHWAPFVMILAVAALVATIGGTMAWLTANTKDGLTNKFTPAVVSGRVLEGEDGNTFNGSTKEKVRIQNTSDVPVYVRVALVPTWVDAQGNPVAEPCSLEDLDIKWGDTKADDWFEADGYYYYKAKVAEKNGTTSELIKAATVKTDNGYQLNLQVLMQVIQAEPATAVNKAWDVTVNNSDGTIS